MYYNFCIYEDLTLWQENNKYVDLTYLEGIADGDTSIIKELVEIFLDQMPEFTEGFDQNLKEKKLA